MDSTQGISAQLMQASEEAKRAVLQGTTSLVTSTSWFGNDDTYRHKTTCTIENGPPQTPEVLRKLATKSGWLLKRNEQHVWQSRWCCVVPHTFLYYFDGHPKLSPLTDASVPSGIIDLECYNTVNRKAEHQNDLVLELLGDKALDPDLPPVHFCALTEAEGEEWSAAIINHRHSSLVDEKEAYRQVCDGSAEQLQALHDQLKSSQLQKQDKDNELYRLRSQFEETRQKCWKAIQHTLEHQSHNTPIPAKKEYAEDLENMMMMSSLNSHIDVASSSEQEPSEEKSQEGNENKQQNRKDLGVLSAVQLLCDYTRVLEETLHDQDMAIEALQNQLDEKEGTETGKEQELQSKMEKFQQHMNDQQKTWMSQIDTLQEKYCEFQKEHNDMLRTMHAQQMEHNIYRSSSKSKITELQSHKKILKKEVLDLRKKLKQATIALEIEEEKNKQASLLSMNLFDGLRDSKTLNHQQLNEALREDASFLLDRRHHRHHGHGSGGEEKKEEEMSSRLSCGAFPYV